MTEGVIGHPSVHVKTTKDQLDCFIAGVLLAKCALTMQVKCAISIHFGEPGQISWRPTNSLLASQFTSKEILR